MPTVQGDDNMEEDSDEYDNDETDTDGDVQRLDNYRGWRFLIVAIFSRTWRLDGWCEYVYKQGFGLILTIG